MNFKKFPHDPWFSIISFSPAENYQWQFLYTHKIWKMQRIFLKKYAAVSFEEITVIKGEKKLVPQVLFLI